MRFRYFRVFLTVAFLIAAFRSRSFAGSTNACTIVTRADVGTAVGHGTVTPGKLQQYPNDPTSQCQYDTDAGNVVVLFDPADGDRNFSAVQGSYGALQTVPGIGDAAVYSKQHGTLAIRKGHTDVLLTLATPDEARGYAVLMALAHRVALRLH